MRPSPHATVTARRAVVTEHHELIGLDAGGLQEVGAEPEAVDRRTVLEELVARVPSRTDVSLVKLDGAIVDVPGDLHASKREGRALETPCEGRGLWPRDLGRAHVGFDRRTGEACLEAFDGIPAIVGELKHQLSVDEEPHLLIDMPEVDLEGTRGRRERHRIRGDLGAGGGVDKSEPDLITGDLPFMQETTRGHLERGGVEATRLHGIDRASHPDIAHCIGLAHQGRCHRGTR